MLVDLTSESNRSSRDSLYFEASISHLVDEVLTELHSPAIYAKLTIVELPMIQTSLQSMVYKSFNRFERVLKNRVHTEMIGKPLGGYKVDACCVLLGESV